MGEGGRRRQVFDVLGFFFFSSCTNRLFVEKRKHERRRFTWIFGFGHKEREKAESQRAFVCWEDLRKGKKL